MSLIRHGEKKINLIFVFKNIILVIILANSRLVSNNLLQKLQKLQVHHIATRLKIVSIEIKSNYFSDL